MNKNVEIIEEGITILECVYKEFEDFTSRGGKRDCLIDVWESLIPKNLINRYIPAIKKICITNKKYPVLPEIIGEMKKFCPFDEEKENE